MCFRLISQLSSYWKPSKGNSQRVSRGLMRFFILFCANGTFLRNSLNILPIMKLDVYKNKLLKIFQYSSYFLLFWGTKTMMPFYYLRVYVFYLLSPSSSLLYFSHGCRSFSLNHLFIYLPTVNWTSALRHILHCTKISCLMIYLFLSDLRTFILIARLMANI